MESSGGAIDMRSGRLPFGFYGPCLPPIKGGTALIKAKKQPAELLLDRVTYTVPQFCARNQISKPTFHKLRSQGLGPAVVRPGLNLMRITAQAERDWQQRMQDRDKQFG